MLQLPRHSEERFDAICYSVAMLSARVTRSQTTPLVLRALSLALKNQAWNNVGSAKQRERSRVLWQRCFFRDIAGVYRYTSTAASR